MKKALLWPVLLTSHVVYLNVQLQRVTNLQTRSAYIYKNKSMAASDRKNVLYCYRDGFSSVIVVCSL